MRTLVAALMLALAVPHAHAADRIGVVASFSILADMAARIAGDRAEVTTLVGPGGDAHVFQPSPADAREIARADLVIVNGLGFEGWMDRLIKAAGFAGPVIVASTGIAPLAVHGHGGVDPHAWQDAANALVYADNIAAGLCAADEKNCAAYRANASGYRKELAALDEEITARFAAIPPQRRRVITSHDAFGYFARAYGVEMLAPVAASTDAEPSAGDMARLIRQIKDEQVTAIFVETRSDARLLERIAEDTGTAIGGTVWSDTLSLPGGPADSYLAMMRHNARAFAAALSGS